MKYLLAFFLAASAFAQTTTITDTIRTPMNGLFTGTVTVTLNNPAQAQPLYSGNVTLSGWSQTVTVTAGVFVLTLYTNDLITPGGTSYTATFAPSSGTGWKETWIVPTGATTIRALRSTVVPSPLVKFNFSQLNQGGASTGQGVFWNGSTWAPGNLLTDPTTTSGDLVYRGPSSLTRLGIGSTGQVLTVAGGAPTWATPSAAGAVTSVSVTTANGVSGTVANPTTTPAITLSLGAITPTSVAASGTVTGSNLSGTNTGDQTNISGNAGTATALAADPADCAVGLLPRGIDATGAAQNCAAVSLASEVTGTLPNANTTATSSNTASAIVARDAVGNFSAGTITAALTGNSSTATALAADPADCAAGQYATAIAASGNLTCASVALSEVAGAVGGAGVLTTVGAVPFVASSGVLGQSANLNFDDANNRLAVGSATVIRSSTDTSLSRSAPCIWQVGDGGANSNGALLARNHIWAGGTEDACSSSTRGQVVMVQGGSGSADTLRVCAKNANDIYAWTSVMASNALQVINSGPTATVTSQVRRVYVDPSSVISALTVTLPAAPLDSDQVQIYFGGTIANRAAVVTTLSIAPNTGQSINQYSAPVNAFGGDMVSYEYRASASRWYRIQ